MGTVGIKALRRIQLVKEVTPGTQITTATAKLVMGGEFENTQEFYRPDDLDNGILESYTRSYLTGEQAKIALNGDANYEQLAYLLGMCIIGGIVGGSPTDSVYTRTFLPNLTSANNPDTYTMQYGDDVEAWIAGFCYATDLELTAALGEKAVMKAKANLVGQSFLPSTFTGAISLPTTLTPVIVGSGQLYIDSSWANLGNTHISNSLVELSYKITPGIQPIKYIDGNIYFSDRAEAKRHVEMSVTFALNSTTAAYFAANYNTSPQPLQFIRCKFTGPLIGATAHAELDLDCAAVIDKWPALSDRQGQDTVKLNLLSQLDPTSQHAWQVILKNGVATLP